MNKIDGIIIKHVQNEIMWYQCKFCRQPQYVVLAPWMVSLLEESAKALSIYTHKGLEQAHTLCGLLIIESPRVEDFSEIEVY